MITLLTWHGRFENGSSAVEPLSIGAHGTAAPVRHTGTQP